MTPKSYAALIASANVLPAERFASSWLLSPDSAAIPGFDPADLDASKRLLLALHAAITRPVREIIRRSGLTQQAFADRFAIPLRTVQNWASGTRTCPAYLRLLLMQQLGQFSPAGDLGLEVAPAKAGDAV